MKKGISITNGAKPKNSEQVKGTFVLDKNLKQHLAVASLASGWEQSQIVDVGLRYILKELGCGDLDSPPILPNLNLQILEAVQR